MAAGNNIYTLGAKVTPGASPKLKSEYVGLVAQCRQILSDVLRERVDAMFEKLDDSFYELAEKASSDAQQERYFDAMRDLRKRRQVILSQFMSGIEDAYDSFWRFGPKPAGPSSDGGDFDSDLSLMDSRELEEDLAVSSMVSKGNNSFYQSLYALEQRFSYMLSAQKVSDKENPLSPAVFGNAIQNLVGALDMEISIKLVVYKLFEREVIEYLGDLYSAINEQLALAGVLPKLKRSVPLKSGTHSAAKPQSKRDNQASRSSPDTAQSDGQAGSSGPVFHILQQALNERRGGQPSAVNTSLQLVPSSELMDALSGMQQKVGAAEGGAAFGEAVALEIRGKLGVSGDDAQRRIGQNEEDVIDIVSMLFEFILEDPGLPDAMRAMLARLQIPILKVVILDKTFLNRSSHPARRLLNSLAQAAVGWNDSMGRGADSLYEQVHQIVARVLREFDDNVELFEELCDQFSEFMAGEQRVVGLAEARAAQVSEGKEKLAQAKLEVDQSVKRSLAKYIDRVPDVVTTILNDGWKGVLLTIYLREGGESQEWQDAVELMDQLVWSVQQKATAKERQALLKSIPNLLKGLRAGLNGVSFDQHRMAAMFKELQACHVRCLRSKPVVQKTSEPAAQKPSGFSLTEERSQHGVEVEEIVMEAPEAGEKGASVTEGVEDEDIALAKQLEVGTWLEMKDEKGELLRAKLSWRSGVSGVCLFVNRKGIKVAELSPDELAQLMRDGLAKVLEASGSPLVDRAMSAMMNDLGVQSPEKT